VDDLLHLAALGAGAEGVYRSSSAIMRVKRNVHGQCLAFSRESFCGNGNDSDAVHQSNIWHQRRCNYLRAFELDITWIDETLAVLLAQPHSKVLQNFHSNTGLERKPQVIQSLAF
jgi:hypothetical protein